MIVKKQAVIPQSLKPAHTTDRERRTVAPGTGMSRHPSTSRHRTMTTSTAHRVELAEPDTLDTDETSMARQLAERIRHINADITPSSRPAAPKPANERRAANHRMTFNPLHPSMELPPDQLIRLMGMHAKQMQKERRKRRSTSPRPAVIEASDFDHITPIEELQENSAQSRPGRLKALTLILMITAGMGLYSLAPFTFDSTDGIPENGIPPSISDTQTTPSPATMDSPAPKQPENPETPAVEPPPAAVTPGDASGAPFAEPETGMKDLAATLADEPVDMTDLDSMASEPESGIAMPESMADTGLNDIEETTGGIRGPAFSPPAMAESLPGETGQAATVDMTTARDQAPDMEPSQAAPAEMDSELF